MLKSEFIDTDDAPELRSAGTTIKRSGPLSAETMRWLRSGYDDTDDAPERLPWRACVGAWVALAVIGWLMAMFVAWAALLAFLRL